MSLSKLGLAAALGAMALFPGTSHGTMTYLGVDYEQATWGNTGTGLDQSRTFSFSGDASGIAGNVVATHIGGTLGNNPGIVGTIDPTAFVNFPSDTTGPNFDSPYYAPAAFEAHRPWLNLGSDRDGGSDVPLISLTYNFTGNSSSDRFIFDFLNLDASSVTFVSATDINGNVYTGLALAALIGPYLGNTGSPAFEQGIIGGNYVVNSTRHAALDNGLEDSDGNNPYGGGGSILVNLPLKQLVLQTNDISSARGVGDGFQMTILTIVPEPCSILVAGGLLGMMIVRRRPHHRGEKRAGISS